MDNRFNTLINILDKIIEKNSAISPLFKIDNSNPESLNAIRCRAFIYLYFESEFNISDFSSIESYITEGGNDGGLDAYYIDNPKKIIYLIQSKFRKNKFENKLISADELAKMEVERILLGRDDYFDKNGNKLPFNSKIKKFQETISVLENYEKKVIILANVKKPNGKDLYSEKTIKKLIGDYKFEIFNFEKSYNKTVFSLCSGTNYDPEEITITIDVPENIKEMVDKNIKTSIGAVRTIVLFVPTLEIAKIMEKYKNAILLHNPRNYLSLEKNEVNKKISNSLTGNQSNDFSILNNGITILANNIKIDRKDGIEKEDIIITAPQLINGAQTAFTLSRILNKNTNQNKKFFVGKEVLLRIIEINDSKLKQSFVEKISDATNQQTKIIEADRRSNDPIQIGIQQDLFNKFGYFYARKKGEFDNGLTNKYLDKELIIDREILVKSFIAYSGKASEARRSSNSLFRVNDFKYYFGKNLDIKKVFLSYQCFITLNQNIKKDKKLNKELKYSRYAIIGAIGFLNKKIPNELDPIKDLVQENIKFVLKRWKGFERFILTKTHNKNYLIKNKKKIIDLDNYYKGNTLNEDLKEYFSSK